MKIIHLGAKNCVTGSCHLMQTNPDTPDSINILWVKFMPQPPAKIRLVHGEGKARKALARELGGGIKELRTKRLSGPHRTTFSPLGENQ